jgi:3-oxoacyl-[acyl-carrier-protein] synthase II
MNRRVVITGCAAITPIGNTKAGIVRHLTEGISGVKPMRSDGLLTQHIHSGVFGTVDYPIDYDFSRHTARPWGRWPITPARWPKRLAELRS